MLNKNKNLIDVHINKAKLSAFAVDIKDSGFEMNANLTLYAGTKQITTVTLGTESWRSDLKIDVPIGVYRSVGRIVAKLEEVAKTTFMSSMKQLPGEIIEVK